MKRLILLLLLLLPLSSALSFTNYDAYRSGESILLGVNGNPVNPLNFNQVELKRGSVNLPLEGDVVLIEDKWFVSFVAPINAGNYTLNLNNVYVREGGSESYKNASANFEVVEKSAGYAIIPGAIVVADNFQLEIRSYLDSSEYITIDFPKEQEVKINPGSNKFTIPVPDNLPRGVYEINVGQYTMPIQVISNVNPKPVYQKVYVSPDRIRADYVKDGKYVINVYNPTNESYNNIKILYDDNLISVSPSSLDLEAGENGSFEVQVLSNNGFNSEVKFDINDETLYIPLEFRDDNESVSEGNATSSGDYYCKEIGGSQCASNQICSGQIKSSLNGPCCIGACQASTTASSGSNGLGYIIGIIVLGIIVFIMFKYRKTDKIVQDKNKK